MEIDGNDSLSIEHKEEIRIFHKSMDLQISSILNNNNKLKKMSNEVCWQFYYYNCCFQSLF